MPISRWKKRYNSSNHSSDGPNGDAIDQPVSVDQGDIPGDETNPAIIEDFVFGTHIYDYIVPAAKDVAALCISTAPGNASSILRDSILQGILGNSYLHSVLIFIKYSRMRL